MPGMNLANCLMLWSCRSLPRLEAFVFKSASNIKASHTANSDGSMVFGQTFDLDPESPDPNVQAFLSQEHPSLRHITFVGVRLPSIFFIPKLLANLRSLELFDVSWGRMIFELLRKTPALEYLHLHNFDLLQEAHSELPMDWESDWVRPFTLQILRHGADETPQLEEEPDFDSDEPFRPTTIVLPHLREIIVESEAPPIWSCLGDSCQNPVISMPNLRKLSIIDVDLELEEAALMELPSLAPKIQELRVSSTLLSGEDLFDCIKALPDLESVRPLPRRPLIDADAEMAARPPRDRIGRQLVRQLPRARCATPPTAGRARLSLRLGDRGGQACGDHPRLERRGKASRSHRPQQAVPTERSRRAG